MEKMRDEVYHDTHHKSHIKFIIDATHIIADVFVIFDYPKQIPAV